MYLPSNELLRNEWTFQVRCIMGSIWCIDIEISLTPHGDIQRHRVGGMCCQITTSGDVLGPLWRRSRVPYSSQFAVVAFYIVIL